MIEARVPFTLMDNADSELFERLLGAVRAVASTGGFILGEPVDAFEQAFADYCDSTFAVGVSSGTDALALALRAVGVKRGDEVIVPANSFIATAEAVSHIGATPRFVDVDPQTWVLTADHVAEAMTDRTTCVIPVHLYGRTVDMDPILKLCADRGIRVVEDAAQAHGARYRGRRVGSLGDAGCFSFYPAKNLGAWGDGGAVTTSNHEVAERVRLLRSHGEQPRYHHRTVGSTARLDAIQAAVLRIKLDALDGWNDGRRRAAASLRAALKDVITVPAGNPDGHDHVFHLFCVQHPERDALREHLDANGIATGIHYPTPIHLSPAYKGHQDVSLPYCEALAKTTCSLPIFPSITSQDVEHVAGAVRAFCEARSGA